MSENQNGAEIAALIREINALINQDLRDKFKGTELTLPQFLVIKLLAEEKRLKLSEISKKMNLANSTVSGIIDRLERLGYVIRVQGVEDKRIVFVEPSEKANALNEAYKNKFTEYLESILNGVDQNKVHEILSGLETLKNLIKKSENE